MHIRKTLPYLLLLTLLLWAVWQAVQINEIKNDTRTLAVSVDALIGEQKALQETIETQRTELSRTISELQSQIEDMKFKPLDIPLAPELQEFTYYKSLEAGIEPEIMFAIMHYESGYDMDAVGYNTNGTRDVGLCQINETNWDWLAAEGINVHDPKGNIRAAIYILSGYHASYPIDKALAAYNAGKAGMLRGGGEYYANQVMEVSNAYKC